MPVLNQGLSASTPMGATLVAGGATFRTWAPCALDVYVITGDELDRATQPGWAPDPADRLVPIGDQTWAGFVPGVFEGNRYLFWIRGQQDSGFKRDPYARELGTQPPFPDCPCLIRDPNTYPWHDSAWRRPRFNDLVIYELHVGTYWAVGEDGGDRRRCGARFLDLVERIGHLRDLGVNAVELLPIQEFPTDFSLGYNGVDYFSPEMEYQVQDPDRLGRSLRIANDMLRDVGQPGLQQAQLAPGPNQLKCLVDLCHLYGLAVIFDIVYNHAGGEFGDRSLWFYDRQLSGDANRSLYFTSADSPPGGNIFAYWQAPVRQFLIDNARFFLREYHIDGLRFDEVSLISERGGDEFCRDLTSTLRAERPEAILIAEHWRGDRAKAVTPPPAGLGFDAAWSDRVRIAVRDAVGQASGGGSAYVNMTAVGNALYPPPGFPARWTTVHSIEDHDIVRWDYGNNRPKELRVPALADYNDRRSWYAASRTRVAMTLLLTAPGIPMLFMGQDIFEDKPWHDDIEHWSKFLIHWNGLEVERTVQDFHRFIRDAIWLRRSHPALRGEGIRVPHVHDSDRVIVIHRWVEAEGRDIVIVASLNDQTLWGHPVDMPWPGGWREIFNSDYYDHFPNQWVAGNAGRVEANQPGRYMYPYGALVTIPANGAVVFVRDV